MLQQSIVCHDMFPVFFLRFKSRQCFLGYDNVFLVTIVMLRCFFKLVSRPKFPCRESISVQVMLQHCLVLLPSRSQPKKYVVIELYRHLACFLVATSFFMLRPRLLCWGCFACHDPNMLCRDNTFFACSIFSCRDLVFLVAT